MSRSEAASVSTWRLPVAESLLMAAGLAFATFLFLRPVWDIDIFWHIAAGRAIAEAGALPGTDIFGYDPARIWVPFQWGYELLMAWMFDRGGWPAVRAFHAVVMLLAFVLIYRAARERQRSAPLLVSKSNFCIICQTRVSYLIPNQPGRRNHDHGAPVRPAAARRHS